MPRPLPVSNLDSRDPIQAHISRAATALRRIHQAPLCFGEVNIVAVASIEADVVAVASIVNIVAVVGVVNIVAVASIEVNIAAVASGVEVKLGIAGFVGDNPVARPGTGNHDTGFEERTRHYIVVNAGGTFDHIGIRDPEVHHQEAKGRPDSGYQGAVGHSWMGCCTGPTATIPNLVPFHLEGAEVNGNHWQGKPHCQCYQSQLAGVHRLYSFSVHNIGK